MQNYIASFFVSFTKKTILLFSFSLATVLEFCQHIFEIYVWNDYKYIGFLATVVIIDTITGTIASRFGRNERISSTKMTGMMIKIILYFCYLVSINVALNFTIQGETAGVFEYLKTILYTYPIAREILSIDENMSVMGYSIFPKWLREKIGDMIDNPPEKNP